MSLVAQPKAEGGAAAGEEHTIQLSMTADRVHGMYRQVDMIDVEYSIKKSRALRAISQNVRVSPFRTPPNLRVQDEDEVEGDASAAPKAP